MNHNRQQEQLKPMRKHKTKISLGQQMEISGLENSIPIWDSLTLSFGDWLYGLAGAS